MSTEPVISRDPTLGAFARRLLVIVLIAEMTLAAWRLSGLAIILFGVILFAIGLDAGVRGTMRIAPLGRLGALAAVVVILVGAIGLSFWFFGNVIAGQIDRLSLQVPQGLRLLIAQVEAHPFGRYLVDHAREFGVLNLGNWAVAGLANLASSIARGAGYAVLTFFGAIYLAAEPDLYRRIGFRLLPRAYWPRAEQLSQEAARVLRRWLLGQMVVMMIIGVLSGFGLWALGIGSAFALGLVGGLLCFIPFVGSVIAVIPATLVALTQGPLYALSVVLMYMAVHFIEGNFLTPLVQAKATSLPPVLGLFAAVGFGILFGVPGVLLAAPLMLFVLAALEILYVQQTLGEPPTQERSQSVAASVSR